MSRCRSCNAEIIWAVTAAGKRMPLDEASNAEGNVLLHENGTCIVLAAGDDREWEDSSRHTSHFATCPNADQHRRPRT